MGIRMPRADRRRFETYLSELLEWNRALNLIGTLDPREVIVKHFLDSMATKQSGLLEGPKRTVDIGSGAGFPGLPLRIVCPGTKLVIVESSGKKADFLAHLTKRLDLDAGLVRDRVEVYGQGSGRSGFDVALARGLASLPVLIEYGLPLLKVGGSLVALKGPKAQEEAKSAKAALAAVGGILGDVKKVDVPFLEGERFLVVVEKASETPARYPRRSGMPAKRPLA